MNSDAECNQTTPVLSFDRFHEDLKMLTKMTPNYCQKGIWTSRERRDKKESKTYMESATFKTVKATEDLAVLIVFDVMKTTKCKFSTTISLLSDGSKRQVREE